VVEAIRRRQLELPLHQPNPPTPAARLPAATEKVTQHPSRNTAQPTPGAAVIVKPSRRRVVSTRKATTPPSHRTSSASVRYEDPPNDCAANPQLTYYQQGAGAGPGCGTCWKLTIQNDSSGRKVSNAGNSIVVMVTNLCPAQGNPLCSQSGLSGTNQYGANLNFDLCIDSKANSALFGNSGVGLGVGNAVQVDCSQWSGSIVR